MHSGGYYFGVDIGGTKTSAGLFDRGFRPVQTATIPTRPQEGCRALVKRMGETCRTLLAESGLSPLVYKR